MHPWAGLPARQSLYSKLADHTGWHIALLAAKTWRDEYGTEIKAVAGQGMTTELRHSPIALKGNIPLHFFIGRLRRHVRDFDPDLVYIYHEPYAAATFQMLRAVRALSDIPVGVRSAQNLLKRYPIPFRQSEAYVYRESDFVVTVSDNVADVMRRKGYRKPIEVIPMPVDLAVFRPSHTGAHEAKNTLRVGFVGRLVPEKGADTAIKAIADVQGIDLVLDIIGSGPDEPRLRTIADTLGVHDRINWRGALDRTAVASAYRELDLLVVPSRKTARWSEQFGRVVIEAAAAEVPAIVTRSGELPSLIGQIGAGWTVGESDHEELARMLVHLDTDRLALHDAAVRARQGAEARFSDEAIVVSLAAALSAAAVRGRVARHD